MPELEFDHLVPRYCRQIILKTMDHVRGAMRGENRLNLKRAVADPHLQKSAQNLTKAVDRDAEDLILDALQHKFSKLRGVKSYTVFSALLQSPRAKSFSAIWTALRAAPLSSWSPATQEQRPSSNAQSLRNRPIWQLSLPVA
jgi:hypothetical protein